MGRKPTVMGERNGPIAAPCTFRQKGRKSARISVSLDARVSWNGSWIRGRLQEKKLIATRSITMPKAWDLWPKVRGSLDCENLNGD